MDALDKVGPGFLLGKPAACPRSWFSESCHVRSTSCWGPRGFPLETDCTFVGRVQSAHQGCIFRLTCSHCELTEEHVLTSAYVKISRTVTRNAVNTGWFF